jgi:hypothetical protein
MSLLTAVLMCGLALGGGASHGAIPEIAAALATLADEAAPPAVRLAEEDVDDEGEGDNDNTGERLSFVTSRGAAGTVQVVAQDEADDEDDLDDLDEDEGDEEFRA